METTRILVSVYLFCLGLCFGSFALATAWRLRKKRNFVSERSECEHCKHVLASKDLIPLFSWLSLRGRCRYCGKKISPLLPLAELTGAIVFTLSYISWPYALHSGLRIAAFALWYVALVLLLILFFYDLQWYKLPNKVVHPLWGVAAVYFVLQFAQDPSIGVLVNGFLAVLVAGGLFWLLYEISDGKWIGFGDVRLGFAIGLFVARPFMAGLVLFVASITGIIFALPSLVSGSRKLTSKVPFGPLLIIGLVVVMLYGQQTLDWYMNTILLLP